MRATAIRWNFREYRFLFTVVPFPETVPNFVCHFKGSLQDPSVFAEKTGQSGRLTILTGPFFALAQDGSRWVIPTLRKRRSYFHDILIYFASGSMYSPSLP